MKQTLLSLFVTLATLSILIAQPTLDTNYFPVPGDTLRTAVDESPTGIVLTAPGGDQSWDFSSLEADQTFEQTVVEPTEGEGAADFPNANVLINYQNGAEAYFRSDENEFANIGYFGDDPLEQGIQVSAPLSPGYVERWSPLAFFDLNENNSALLVTIDADQIPGNIFDGLPIAPDSIRVNLSTERTDLVDGWGELTIPGGTYDVLREKRIEHREVFIEARATFTPWVDVTDFVLELLPIDELGTDTLVSYYFWSNDVKEPVAIIRSDAAGNTVESIEFKDNGVISSTNPVQAKAANVSVYPNPAIVETWFSFSGLSAGNYQLELFNLAGSKVWSNEYYINGERKVRVPLGNLRKGLYLYALQDSNGQRIAVNRLVIVRP